jgi:hypothetical protein
VTCPVCELRHAVDAAACPCGYDFTTRDPSLAIARFTRAARHGNAIWRRGLLALIALPIPFMLLDFPTGIMLGTLQFFLSLTWIVLGLVRADGANKRLAAAKELLQLPQARLL